MTFGSWALDLRSYPRIIIDSNGHVLITAESFLCSTASYFFTGLITSKMGHPNGGGNGTFMKRYSQHWIGTKDDIKISR